MVSKMALLVIFLAVFNIVCSESKPIENPNFNKGNKYPNNLNGNLKGNLRVPGGPMIFMDSLQPNVLKQEKRENGMKQEEIRANRIEINVLLCQMIVRVNEGIGISSDYEKNILISSFCGHFEAKFVQMPIQMDKMKDNNEDLQANIDQMTSSVKRYNDYF